MGKVYLNFVIALILATIAVIVISVLLSAYAGFEMGSGANFIPVMIAALYAGQRHGVRTKAVPPSGFAWRAALGMAGITASISLVALGAMMFVIGQAFPWDLLNAPLGLLTAIFAGLMCIQFLLIRFFFSMGAKQTVKALDRQTRETF